MRLCDRRGTDRVEAAFARAIAFDVCDVPRIERMLKLARWPEAGAARRRPLHDAAAEGRRCAVNPAPSRPSLSPL